MIVRVDSVDHQDEALFIIHTGCDGFGYCSYKDLFRVQWTPSRVLVARQLQRGL